MRRRLRDQGGMTVIEVLVAATILVVGIATAVTALNGSRRLTLKSERTDQAVAIGQREIERLRGLPFENLATTTLPVDVAEQPSAIDLLVAANGVLGLKVAVPAKVETFVPASTAGQPLWSCIAPASEPDTAACPAAGRISSGPTRGRVWRFVTWQQSCVNITLATACASLLGSTAGVEQASLRSAKRVTVVVALDADRGLTSAPVQTDTVVAQ